MATINTAIINLTGTEYLANTAYTVLYNNDDALNTELATKLAKASNLSDVSNRQTALNNLADVASATNEHVLTKDTTTGNLIFKASAGGGGVTINTLTEKTTLVDNDLFLIEDSENSNTQKKVKKSNIISGTNSNYSTRNYVALNTVPLPTANQVQEFIDSSDNTLKWKNNLGSVYPAPSQSASIPDNLELATKISAIPSSTQIVVQWAEESYDIKYKIYWATLGSVIDLTGSPSATVNVGTTQYAITGLTNSTEYEIYVIRVKKPISARTVSSPGSALSNFKVDSADSVSGATGQVVLTFTPNTGITRHDLVYEQTKNSTFYNPSVVQGTTGGTITVPTITRFGSELSSSSSSRTSYYTTITTTTDHGFAVDDIVFCSGANEASFNGYFSVTEITSTTVFKVRSAGNDESATGTLVCKKLLPYLWMVKSVTSDSNLTPSSITRSSGITTIVTNSVHGLSTNNIISISGANESSFNGKWVVLSIVDTTTFTITNTGSDESATGTITLTSAIENARTTAVNQECVERYFTKIYSAGTSVEYMAWSVRDPNNGYIPEVSRTLQQYKDLTSFSDADYVFNKAQYLVESKWIGSVKIKPQSAYAVQTVFGNFTGSRAYGSVFYANNLHTTANQLTLDSFTNRFNVANDDNDSTGFENDGSALVASTNGTDQTSTMFMRLDRSLNTDTSVVLQYDIPAGLGSSGCASTIFWAAPNGNSNRRIKLFADYTNSRFAYKKGATDYYISFSSLSISPVYNNYASFYVVGDGIDEVMIGNFGSSAWTVQFNWENNTASARSVTGITTGYNATEEDAFGTNLYTVNGKIFYLYTINSNSTTWRSLTWRLIGNLDDATAGTIDHLTEFTPYGNQTYTTGIQCGMDLFTLIDTSMYVYAGDWGHDASGIFDSSTDDTAISLARTNIKCLVSGL